MAGLADLQLRQLQLGVTGTGDWLPDYHGDALFMKIHRPPQALPDPRLNWENPFAFSDTDGDGLTEMGMRWLDPMMPVVRGLAPLSGVLNEAFLTLDLDNDSGKGNEIDYDACTKLANHSWHEALAVYRAAWKRGLTTPEMDKLANAASVAERHANDYWIKEKAFREMCARLKDARKSEPSRVSALDTLEKDLTRLYYLGPFDVYVARIADVPGR